MQGSSCPASAHWQVAPRSRAAASAHQGQHIGDSCPCPFSSSSSHGCSPSWAPFSRPPDFPRPKGLPPPRWQHQHALLSRALGCSQERGPVPLHVCTRWPCSFKAKTRIHCLPRAQNVLVRPCRETPASRSSRTGSLEDGSWWPGWISRQRSGRGRWLRAHHTPRPVLEWAVPDCPPWVRVPSKAGTLASAGAGRLLPPELPLHCGHPCGLLSRVQGLLFLPLH